MQATMTNVASAGQQAQNQPLVELGMIFSYQYNTLMHFNKVEKLISIFMANQSYFLQEKIYWLHLVMGMQTMLLHYWLKEHQ